MRKIFAASLVAAGLAAGAMAARADEELQVGGVGGANAVVWLHYIAEQRGFYAARIQDRPVLFAIERRACCRR